MDTILIKPKQIAVEKAIDVDSVAQEELLKEWIRMKKDLGQDPKVSVDEIPSIVNHSGFEGAEKMESGWLSF